MEEEKKEIKNTPKQETTPVAEEVSKFVKDTTKKRKTTLTIVISILILIILILLAIIFTPYIKTFAQEAFPNLPFWSDEFEDEMEEEAAEENTLELQDEIAEILDDQEEEEMETFEGDVITAELPEGWSIEEYFDGDGTDMLVSGITYEGITGLKIFNPDDENVFSMIAVSGIGFVGCGDYAKFSDDNPAYYQEQVDMNDEIGETMTEHDYTNTEYEEFEWMGTTMRRIDDDYYYDTEEGNNYFEPPCQAGLIVLEGFSFEDSDGYIGEAYFYGLEEIAVESEYEIVDSILESMEGV